MNKMNWRIGWFSLEAKMFWGEIAGIWFTKPLAGAGAGVRRNAASWAQLCWLVSGEPTVPCEVKGLGAALQLSLASSTQQSGRCCRQGSLGSLGWEPCSQVSWWISMSYPHSLYASLRYQWDGNEVPLSLKEQNVSFLSCLRPFDFF